MKKIKITERQESLINEIEVVQYQGNSHEIKHFYTKLNNGENTTIDWESNNSLYNNYDLEYHNNESVIEVDWVINFLFDEGGFKFIPKINSVHGKITLTQSFARDQKPVVIDISHFKINTDKLKYSLDDYEDYSYHLNSVNVNLDDKTLYF